jgi:hypothetical protein
MRPWENNSCMADKMSTDCSWNLGAISSADIVAPLPVFPSGPFALWWFQPPKSLERAGRLDRSLSTSPGPAICFA